MTKAIIFDCFGVLYVHHGPDYIKDNVTNYSDIKNEITYLSDQADIGSISQAEYELKAAELTKLPIEQIHAHVKNDYNLNQNLMTYIQSVLRPDYKVGLLSNISRNSVDAFFNQKQQAELFDEVVLSSEVGMIKPDPAIYRYICQKLGVEPREAIMVDDIYDNCLGAESIGMKYVLYDNFINLQNLLQKYL